MLGYRAKIPDNAESGHQHQKIIRDIDLPPVKPLAHSNSIMMVVIVPPFAERYE
jgi:hypothetical protein